METPCVQPLKKTHTHVWFCGAPRVVHRQLRLQIGDDSHPYLLVLSLFLVLQLCQSWNSVLCYYSSIEMPLSELALSTDFVEGFFGTCPFEYGGRSRQRVHRALSTRMTPPFLKIGTFQVGGFWFPFKTIQKRVPICLTPPITKLTLILSGSLLLDVVGLRAASSHTALHICSQSQLTEVLRDDKISTTK